MPDSPERTQSFGVIEVGADEKIHYLSSGLSELLGVQPSLPIDTLLGGIPGRTLPQYGLCSVFGSKGSTLELRWMPTSAGTFLIHVQRPSRPSSVKSESESLSLDSLRFADLFNLDEIQALQDAFSRATGVASIITMPNGVPITKPSNFCRLCTLIRSTERGLANCIHSDAVIGGVAADVIVQPCLSGGLWDGGTSIRLGNNHLANWLIGQVRDERQEEHVLLNYADEIGLDRDLFADALREVPTMSAERFRDVTDALYLLARQLSELALRNARQAHALRGWKHAEHARARSELLRRRSTQALGELREGVLICDELLNVDFCNDTWGGLFAVDPSEVRALKDAFAPNVFATQINQLLFEIRVEGSATRHFQVPSSRDGFCQILLSGSQLHDEHNVPDGFALVARDISHQRRVEAQLRASQRLESIGRLAGGVAHDINNLLSPILSYAEMLILDLREGSQEQEDLEVIHEAGLRVKGLTQQLLAFSRKQVLDTQIVDFSEVIEECLGIVRRTLREDITLHISIPGDSFPVLADTHQIDQIVMNLVLNAQDALPQGGAIHLGLRRVSLDSKQARDLEVDEGDYVLLELRDDGIGMDEETLEHAFEPFYTTRHRQGGTGLGLATVHGIVRQHQGAIRVESKPNTGTCFHLHFPLAQGSIFKRPPSEQSKATLTQHLGKVVLVVEDNLLVLDLVSRILSDAGFHVLATADPLQVDAILQGQEPNVELLVTDVILPKRNGVEVYQRVKERYPEMKVVFMSGYTNQLLELAELSRKNARFISKPITPDLLLKAINNLLKH